MLWIAVALFVVLGLGLVFVLRGGEKSLPKGDGIKDLVDRRKPK